MIIVNNMGKNGTERVQPLIYKIVEAVNTTENLGKLFPAIRRILGEVLDTTNFRIALYDRENDTISLPYMADEYDTYNKFVAGRSLTAYVIRENRPLLLNPEGREQLIQMGSIEPIGHPAKVWLGVPLRVKQDVIGAVVVQSYTDPALYTDDDRRHLELVSEQIGVAISRKQAQDRLRESEQRFRSVVENSHAGIVIVDDKYRFTYVNAQMCRISGYSRKELVGQDFRDFLDEESKRLVAKRYLLRRQGEEPPTRYEFDIICKHGERRRVEISSTLIEDSKGNLRTVAQLLDITEQKRAEEALQESERKFRTLFDQMPDALFLEDTDGRIIDANESACKLLGYNHEEITDITVDDLVPEGNPAFLPGEIDEATREGRPLETVNKRKDGTPVPIELRGRIIKLGEEKGMLVSVRDITERKRMEEELREYKKAVMASGDSIYLIGKDFRYVFANDEHMSRLFEDGKIPRKREDEVLGRKYGEIHPEKERESLKEYIATVLDTGEPVTEEYEFKTEERWSSRTYSPVKNPESEEVEGVVVVSKDITKRKKAEEKLRESEARFRAIFENTTIGMYRTAVDGRILMANPALVRMLGYSSFEELAERDLDKEGFGSEHPRSVFLQRIESEGQVIGLESAWTRRDRVEIFVCESARVIRDEAGNTLYYEGTVEDITERKQAEARLNLLNAVLRAIRDVNQLISREHNRDRLIQGACEGLTGPTSYDSAWVVLLDEAGRVISSAEAGLGDAFLPMIEGLQRGQLPVCAQKALSSPGVVTVEDPATMCRGCPLAEDCGSKAIMTVRLEHGGKIYGLISVSLSGKLILGGEGCDLLKELAGDIAFALHDIESEEKLRATSKKIERLHAIARQLEACSTEDDVYRLTIEAAEQILTFSMCTLDILEEDKLVVKATTSGLPPGASREINLEHGERGGLAAKTFLSGETTVFGDLSEVPEAKPTREDFKSGISAPIGDIGVFQVVSTEPSAFAEEDTRLLELLLGHTLEAVKRIRLRIALRKQAIHDPLTGVYNRRYFNERIEEELERSRRYEHPVRFLMMDVDRFKEINDRFGHQMGDKVLQTVAKVLEKEVRESDIVIRYGGDEFLIVLPETDGEAEAVVQRIRQALAKRNEERPLIEFPVTLAVGSSHWRPGHERPLEEVLAEADQRMYEEKKRYGQAISPDKRSQD